MGIAIAGMLTASLTTLPDGAWEAVIPAVLAAWFAGRVHRRRSPERPRRGTGQQPYLPHPDPQLRHDLHVRGHHRPAAASSGAGMSGMSGGSGSTMPTLSAPVVAFIFAAWLIVYVVLDLDRLAGPGHGHGSYFAPLAAAPASRRLVGAMAGSGSVSLRTSSAGPAGTGGSVATVPPQASGPGQPPGAGDGGASTGDPVGSARTFLLGPKVAAGCRIAMGVTMAFMLIIMI